MPSMWRSCSKCGRVHRADYKCTAYIAPKDRTADQRLRSTSRWQKKSEEIREASQHLCAVCRHQDQRFNYNNLEVHHIIKLKDEPSKLLDNFNLVCLCKYHHELADAGKIDASYLEELARCREEGKDPPTLQR